MTAASRAPRRFWRYDLAWALALPLAMVYLLWRGRKQAEYRQHWRERLGHWPRAQALPSCLWVHAVSVGETRAAVPLILALAQRWPEQKIVVTQMTPTGRAMAEQTLRAALGDRLVLSYLPYDRRAAIDRFVQQFRPQLGVLIETEVWPNLALRCAALGVPLFLASARLSERSMRKAQRRFPRMAAWSLQALRGLAAQTEHDAQRLRTLLAGVVPGAQSSGATPLNPPMVEVLGNLKFDQTPDPAMLVRGRQWRSQWLSVRPGVRVVMSASTREGEETLVLPAMLAPDRLWLLVPRHPQRFDEVYQLLVQRGLRVARHSRGDPVSSDTQVILGDTLGEMQAWFAACDLACIGGSLLPLGGQNLIEAAACGAPTLMGPHAFNFAQATEDAVAAGACLRVADVDDLGQQIEALYADPTRLAAMREAAIRFSAAHAGATQRHVAWIAAHLAPST